MNVQAQELKTFKVKASHRLSPVIWLSPITGWMLLFYAVPVIFILLTSFMSMENYRLVSHWTFANYLTIFKESMYHQAYLASLGLAFKAVVLTTLIAYPLAYALAFVVPKRWRLVFWWPFWPLSGPTIWFGPIPGRLFWLTTVSSTMR